MEVEIYVKPDCKNNKKQIEMLKERGHKVIVKNIFEENWSKNILQSFFHNIPFEKWYNPYAPVIKSGEVDPGEFTKDNIIKAMIIDNYLIRRPLLKVGDQYDCGFDSSLAQKLMENSDVNEVLVCHQAGNVCD